MYACTQQINNLYYTQNYESLRTCVLHKGGKYVINIEKLEKSRVFAYLSKHHLIDTLEFRNLKIRRDFALMRREMCAFDAFYLLSEKYSLSFETIRTILFRSSRRKYY